MDDLNERAQQLFKALMERYLTDGLPIGSRVLARDVPLDLSPATVRNVMADLEELGLIRSPHTSAGRVPTLKGYRLFIDSMLTFRDPPRQEVERMWEDLQGEEDMQHLLRRTSVVLSEFTRLACVVTLPRTETRELRHMEFIPLGERRVLAVLVLNGREVQNRIVHTDRNYSPAELVAAANFLNEAFVGRDIREVQEALVRELAATQEEMTQLMRIAVEMSRKIFPPATGEDAGMGEDEGGGFVLSGETKLMECRELSDVEKLRQLFETFNQKRDVLHLLDRALHAQGVQIYLGKESGYDAFEECSVVTATYKSEGRVLGVLGVIGPTRIPFERIVPLVDITAKMLGNALKSIH
jgi:heat-inducible transcriptional repressor